MRYVPSVSIKLLLPAPGTPVIPMRTDWPLWGRQSSRICSASSRSEGRPLSIIVTARARIARSPLRMPFVYSSRVSVVRFFDGSGACGVSQPASSRSALFIFSIPLATSDGDAGAEQLENLLCGHRNHRAGAVDAGDSGFEEECIILRRNDAAYHDQNVFTTHGAQLVNELRHESLMCSGEA